MTETGHGRGWRRWVLVDEWRYRDGNGSPGCVRYLPRVRQRR